MTKLENLKLIHKAYEALIPCIANNVIQDMALVLGFAPAALNDLIQEEETASRGAELIAQERRRQVDKKGFTPEYDAGNDMGELPMAAIAYIYDTTLGDGDKFWPGNWDKKWFKPHPTDSIRNLTKAGALIAAEIDRVLKKIEGE